MEAYHNFAKVYDMFMDNIPYEEWGDYLFELLKRHSVSEGLLLELGCGTGNITRYLYSKGFNMIGLDNSEDMLAIAKDKSAKEQEDILYLFQDMREFELYGTVGAIVSICDSINYILEPEELLSVFKLVNNYLDPGGVFIFDINTPYKYEMILGEQTIAENREDSAFIWDNYYDPESMINTYDLSIFIKKTENDEDTETFYRFNEEHYQRAYSFAEIEELLGRAGLVLAEVFDAFTMQPPHAESERIYIIAKEVMK